jgi:hypothetical protein
VKEVEEEEEEEGPWREYAGIERGGEENSGS